MESDKPLTYSVLFSPNAYIYIILENFFRFFLSNIRHRNVEQTLPLADTIYIHHSLFCFFSTREQFQKYELCWEFHTFLVGESTTLKQDSKVKGTSFMTPFEQTIFEHFNTTERNVNISGVRVT